MRKRFEYEHPNHEKKYIATFYFRTMVKDMEECFGYFTQNMAAFQTQSLFLHRLSLFIIYDVCCISYQFVLLSFNLEGKNFFSVC